MKRAGRYLWLMVLVISIFAIVLTGCGGGGGGGTSGGGTGGGGGTAIQNSTQATQSASVGTQAARQASGQAQLIGNLTVTGLSSLVGAPQFKVPQVFKPDAGMQKAIKLTGKLSKMKALKAPMLAIKKARGMKTTVPIPQQTSPCPDGGSVTFSGQYDDQTGAFNLDFNFNNCREDDTQLNGPMHFSGTLSSNNQVQITMTLGTSPTNLELLEFSNDYATLVTKMEFAGVSITETYSWTSSSGTISSTANGNISIFDYMSQEQYTMTFTNLKEDITYNETSTQFSLNIKTNGGFSVTWTEQGVQNSVAITYTDFVLNITDTNTYNDTTVSGKIVTDFTPDSCFEGTFVFETVTPIHYDYSVGHITAGHLKINGNTHMEWKSDGTIIVWLDSNGNGSMDSGEVAYQGDEYGLAQVCDFATFNEEEPQSTGSGGGSATGNSMTITLSWTGGDTSDMDLHLNYYNTTSPTSTTHLTWYVDWHGKDSCSNGYSGADFDGDGNCEVYLDFDDTEGYGPEHITATQLPAGYYVVSVNSYDLDRDPSASVNVTIQIGDAIFGPYTTTFTTADYEGQDPSAWFAVADIVVDSNGNATVKAHDPALPLWHTDPNYGLPAPKKTKRMR